MRHKNMTLDQYADSLKYDCARYGFTVCPLSDLQIETCYMTGLNLDTAYTIACDVNAGFTFLESYSITLKNLESI